MTRTSNLHRLRAHAIAQSLFPPTTLRAAIDRLGFIQADPIRSPARAQDLILRHRVKGYCAGDLEQQYPSLDVEEDYLYAYGFMPRTIWRLVHPRSRTGLSALEKKVLDLVSRYGPTHPRTLEAHLGPKRVINAWGGYSKATTSALEDLHYRGLVRIARRENGIRIYEAAPPFDESASPAERLRKLIMTLVHILSPVPEKTLHANIARLRRLGNPRTILGEMLRAGELENETIDGVRYLWLPSTHFKDLELPRVRFLAPFDPLVWDRRRFEHLWGWPYRFEAYTPAAKRVRGYYAMPLLWRDRVIGWVNASLNGGSLDVETGFVQKRPREKEFRTETDAEIARMEKFLNV